jgi:hypothetical protein
MPDDEKAVDDWQAGSGGNRRIVLVVLVLEICPKIENEDEEDSG